jgi:adenylate cyclase, class 2
METEIEAKFPDINPKALRASLKKLGAKLEHAEVLMKRKTFDLPEGDARKGIGWVRLRDEGDKITLAYKQLNDRSLHGTKEVMVTVNDFEKTCSLLENVGLKAKSYQETKREKWTCDGVEITIDTWPWVPTFVELEGSTEAAVRKAAATLNLDWNKAMHGSVEPVYQMHYDFTDAEIDAWPSITFTPPPAWLLAKAKRK